jgi:outer membrane lipoprotein SlyB
MLQTLKTLFSAALLAILSGCATQGSMGPGEMEIRSGVIEQIYPTQIANTHQSGVGAIVGGVVGLGLGSLIGNGSGRDVAMVLGTIGGAYAGNEIQKKHDQPIPAQQIVVRTTNGVLVSVTQPTNPSLYAGQKVFIEGSGDGARVVLR